MQFIHEKISKGYDTLNRETTDNGRRYVTPDGVAYPSVTTVTGILSAASIAKWKARVGEEEANKIGSKAAKRGTAVHDLIEQYLSNNPHYAKGISPHIMQSLVNLNPILNDGIEKIYELEVALFSDHLKMAGTCDCVCIFEGVPTIVDFKTSKWPKKKSMIGGYFQQAAAYAIMWEEQTGMAIPNLAILMDVDGGKPIVFKEHRDNWTQKLHETIELYNSQKKEVLFG